MEIENRNVLNFLEKKEQNDESRFFALHNFI